MKPFSSKALNYLLQIDHVSQIVQEKSSLSQIQVLEVFETFEVHEAKSHFKWQGDISGFMTFLISYAIVICLTLIPKM